ncbi:MAG: Ig-like domain-containing protein [Ruminococcus sp.]|nr:Ig-like domain-containing protein [Ruminococcus sp.]
MRSIKVFSKKAVSVILSLLMILTVVPAMSLTAYAVSNIYGDTITVFESDSGTLSSDMTCSDFEVVDSSTLTINQGVTLTLNCGDYGFSLFDNSQMELHGILTGSVSDGEWSWRSYINVYLSDGAKYTVTGLSCMDGDNYLVYYGYDAATDGNGTVSVKNGSTDVTSTSKGYKATTYTFTATPNDGYKFVNWTKGAGGEVLGTDASINVTCEQNGQYQVYANFEEDADNTEKLLTTITPTGKTTHSATVDGVVTVSHNNDSYDGSYGWLWSRTADTLTVSGCEGYTITKVIFKQNAKSPVTDSSAPFELHFVQERRVVCQENSDMDGVTSIEVYGYATPAHTHNFSYTAEGDTITATCTATGCDLTDSKVTLKIVPNSVLYYDDNQPKEASLEGLEAFNAATGKSISTNDIAYYKGDTNVTAQIKAGSGTSIKATTYTARLDVEGVRAVATFKLTAKPVPHTHSFTYTANGNVITATCTGTTGTCDLTNKQATLTLNAPEHATYDDGKNANATITGEIPGVTTPTINYRRSDTPLSSAPTDAGTYTAWCQLGNATARVEYTVAKAVNPGYTTLPHAVENLVYTGEEQELITAGATNTGQIAYTAGTNPDSEPDVTTGGMPYSYSVPKMTDAGTYYVWCKLDGGKNYTSLGPQKITVTIAKADINPTVTLDGWTYGEEANAPVVDGNTGNGDVAYTYAVKGSDEYSETVPTDAGEYTVKAEIADTDNYNGATVTADFTITKAKINPTVTLEGWAYGKEANEPSVSGNAGNGEVTYSYAVEGSDNFSTDVPAKVGKYTVKAEIAETDNYFGATVTADFTIAKAEINPTVTLDGWTYGEEANKPIVEGNTGNGEVTYTYAVKGSDEYSEDVPTNAGTYTVKAEIAATGDYTNAVATADFTIAKAVLTVTAKNQTVNYGSSVAQGKYTVKGLAEGDTVDVKLYGKIATNEVKSTVTASSNYTVKKVSGILTIKLSPIARAVPSGKNLTVKYTKVQNADGYDIYAGYCGTSSYPLAKSIKGNTVYSTTLTKIGGKAIDTKKNVFLYVVAYKNVNGKKVTLVRSASLHIAGANSTRTNVKSVKVAKTAISLKKGKTTTLKPTVTLVNNKKHAISCTNQVRYASCNKSIATVDANGKITAVAPGTVNIYAYASNGVRVKIVVTVK